MKPRKNAIIAAIFCLLANSAISSNQADALPAESASAPARSTDFALGIFRKETSDLNKNVVVSPFSAYMALSMTANGANGETKAQMARLLGANPNDLTKFNAVNHAALQSLNRGTNVTLEIANALYADKSYPFKQPFIALCQKAYSAESSNENFADPLTVRKINSWCSQRTHGKINAIIDRFNSDEKLVLLNSVYFKGSWLKEFSAKETRQADFHLLNGNTTMVPMMRQKASFAYGRFPGFDAIAIPYSGGKQLMYIFLPAVKSDFSRFLDSFTPRNWNQWTGALDSQEIMLKMPKYRISFAGDLSTSLKAMGMSEAFSPDADFSAMCASSVKIGRVLQKTYVDVDEKGSEAAAATAVVSMSKGLFLGPQEFVVDHPFVMAIADRETNQILFIGAIVDPTLK